MTSNNRYNHDQPTVTEKICPGECGLIKPASEFNRARKSYDGLQHYCKDCQNIRHRKSRTDSEMREYERVKSYERNIRGYGITPDQYDQMVVSQGGMCSICSTSDPGCGGRWAIDHDHNCCPANKKSCGKCVRGLLCCNCNNGLGRFMDNVDNIANALAYLLEWENAHEDRVTLDTES